MGFKRYTRFFIACSKEFYGFYESSCTASPCTPTLYENSACGGGNTVRLVYNGQERCKECWFEGVEETKHKKLIVTIRTFLPYNYVNDPLNGEIDLSNPPFDPNTYKYNQDIWDLANIRDYPIYKNVALHGSYKTKQIFELDFENNSFIHPTFTVPQTAIFNNISKNSTVITNNESTENGTDLLESRISKGERIIKFRAKISSGNPAFDPSTNIDYDLTFEVADKGNYRVNGIWDGFPAIEIFMEDTETGKVDLVYYLGTEDARQTPKPKGILKLFDFIGDINVNLYNDMGNKPFSDQRAPYDDVKKMLQIFKDYFYID